MAPHVCLSIILGGSVWRDLWSLGYQLLVVPTDSMAILSLKEISFDSFVVFGVPVNYYTS